MKKYYYADDGGIEVADVREIIIDNKEIGQCYHCERWMYIGDAVVELRDTDGDVYTLHKKCFERNADR